MYAYASSSRGDGAGADPSWLEDAYARFPEPVTRAIRHALSSEAPPYRSPVDEVRIPTWHDGNVILLGDAAHATGPVWAQGAAMAMEDAVVLADLLAEHEDWSAVGPGLGGGTPPAGRARPDRHRQDVQAGRAALLAGPHRRTVRRPPRLSRDVRAAAHATGREGICPMTHVEVGGLSIAYEKAGTGPAVLLTHGFVGDARATWGGQIDALCDEFTVIAWNAPGSGGSSDPPEEFGMDAYADCLAGFFRALRIERAHLVGLSFGASLGLATFHRHRRLVSSLALVSGYAGWLGSLGTEEADLRLARSIEASTLRPEEFVAAMAPSMFSPSAAGDQVASFLESVRQFHPSGFRAMALASHADQRQVLAEVDVPTLLLFADHDVRAPVSVGEVLRAAIPGSELVVLTRSGHASPVEAPLDVARELRRFLRMVEKSLA